MANRIFNRPCEVHEDSKLQKNRVRSIIRQNGHTKRFADENDGLMTRQPSITSTHRKVGAWKQRFCDWKWKFLLFYSAPITSFWIWAMSFSIFMLTFIYVLLIEFPEKISYLEWFQFCYVLAVGLEHFRKLLILESSSFVEKVQVFYNRYWNILTTVAVATYFAGFAFRFDPSTTHSYGRVILASNCVLWHMKVYDYLSVHPKLGPYITMAGKMVLAMSYIIIMLLVCLMAFGVVRQSITYPHEKWGWILVRNIFYKPYFMLYGEVYAGEIDTCGDEGTNCIPGYWLPPIFMTLFMLIANILLINMIISIFNNIFVQTNAISQQVWMFQRYNQVLEYESTPIVPPPFTPIVHLFMLFEYLFKGRACKRKASKRHQQRSTRTDFSIKIFVDADELKRLHDFEEDCMDDYLRRKQIIQAQAQNSENSLQKIIDGNNELGMSMKQILEEHGFMKMQIKELQESLLRMRTNHGNVLGTMQQNPVHGRDQETDANAQVPLRIQVYSPEHPIPPDASQGTYRSSTYHSDVEEPTHSQNRVRFYMPQGSYLSPTWYSPPVSPNEKRSRNRNSVSLSEELAQMLRLTGSDVPEMGVIETSSVRSFHEIAASSSESLGPNEVVIQRENAID